MAGQAHKNERRASERTRVARALPTRADGQHADLTPDQDSLKAEARSTLPELTIVAHDIGLEGGMEHQLTELILGLLRDGHRVTVISWTCSLAPQPDLRWVRVPGPSRPFVIGYPLFLLLGSLLVSLRGRGVVHSTGAIILNRTSACTVHYCHHAAGNGPSRISRAGFAFRANARVGAVMKRLGERFCYRPGRAQGLVGVSEGVARELRRYFPKMRDRIHVIPNGVDTEVFRPSSGDDDPTQGAAGARQGLNVLFVGSEWERKGLNMAIESLHGLADTRLVVVGKGDTEAYRALAESLSLADRVSFAGATADVAPHYRRADVFLMPTIYEAAPLVTYEAAASGLPLLVTQVNGVEDLLRDGVNGWFIKRDPSNIREYLRKLQSDPQLRAEMGAAARQDSLLFSWSTVVQQYRRFYEKASYQ